MKLHLLVFLIVILSFSIFAQSLNEISASENSRQQRESAPPLEPGVSQSLAQWRAANYSDVRYKLNITLEKSAPLMKGSIEISVKLTEEAAKNDLILDWRTTQFQNDKDKPFADVEKVNESIVKETLQTGVYDYQTNKEHLLISKKYLKTGENTIRIKFASPVKTSGSAITRYIDKEDGAEYVYSMFVPSDASTAFPVFDQPDLKARFELEITAPKGWSAVSNEDGFVEVRGRSSTLKFSFRETKPISTYVFAFAVGEFAQFTEGHDEPILNKYFTTNSSETIDFLPRDYNFSDLLKIENGKESLKTQKKNPADSVIIYVRKSQAEKFKTHAKEVFRLNREGVKFLEDYFDYKFPFPKYDLVLIPEFSFSGMEHAGAAFLRESSVIFPTAPTKNNAVSRANIIFHEAAHQWFGDCVTMRWFDDLWLKEGFAEFMAYKTLEKVMPEYNAWKIFYEREKQAAYSTDSTKGTTPIYQEIPNLSAAKLAYGNIVYRKAPSFLRQTEFFLGENEFQTAVRAFLKNHQYSNAEWTDLVKEFEAASKLDLKDWANVWVKQRGAPIIRTQDCDINSQPCKTMDGYAVLYNLNQKGTIAENDHWQMSANILIADSDGKRSISRIKLGDFDEYSKSKSTTYFTAYQDLNSPQFIFPNYQDYGYGIFLLDDKSRAYVLANIQTEKDDFLRTMMWGSLWDAVRETELAPADYVRLVIKNINVETDESTIQTLLDRVEVAMNYYLSDKQREKFVPRLEAMILQNLQQSRSKGVAATYYRAFVNLAATERACDELKIILRNGALEPRKNRTDKYTGVFLKAKDRFDIVARLLILGDKDATQILAELEKRETSDEAKRYAYAAKAGIATPENKAKFWSDFVSNKEISESYIESAVAVFNSPKHSELTLPYLEKSLAELPNLKRDRKIFFVDDWLGAFIGGQKSEAALSVVNKFLAENPKFDKDLRLKILENADNLERAVKIRAKYGANKI